MQARDFSWLNVPAEEAARRLLDCELVSTIDGKTVRVRIVETEAYDQNDPASHTYAGETKRNQAMFLGAGHLYVYFTYGMHYCCNIVCEKAGFGAGVLIRAVEPLDGLETIEKRRKTTGISLTNGPGKVAQALGVTTDYTGHDLATPPIELIKQPPLADHLIATSPRVGISKNIHALRRFYIKDNSYVSNYKRIVKS